MSNLPQATIDQFVGNAHGNYSVVKDLLTQYPDLLNLSASWVETAIEAAAQTAQLEIVSFLLTAGAPLDICTAAVLGQQGQVERMLQADPDQVNARGAHGIPLLYFPIIRGHQALAEYLLTHGADLNLSSPGGITPLHGAVMFDQIEMAAWLLGHGAHPNPLYDDKTPFRMAQEKGLHKLAELIRSYGGIE